MKRTQHGVSMMGFIGLLIVFGLVAMLAMKLFPMYREYYAVKAAFKGVASDASVGRDITSIRSSLSKRFDVGYVDDELIKSVRLENADGGKTMVIDYDRESSVAGPIGLIGHFHVAQPLGPSHTGDE